MKIKLHEILIQDVVKGYTDDEEEGVYGMNGGLNIRPQYQREFIYKDKQRDDVVRSIRKDYPLNVLYWVENDDGGYEVLDGQQRLISIGRYVSGDFSIEGLAFHNLPRDQQEQILNYKLMVYFCKGTDSKILAWFETINIAGEKLSDQELKNAVYAGPWVSDARRYFSKKGCSAYQIEAYKYLRGDMKRQDYLETAIKWINNGDIKEYMSGHQPDKSAKPLWEYFEGVINWVKKIFPTYRKEMKGVPFGLLYNEYWDNEYDQEEIEGEVCKLMMDEDVTKKSGIYSYIFTGNEKFLSIRTFADSVKRTVYEKQGGRCVRCGGENFGLDEMEADHIEPWSRGGKTVLENCQMLCLQCNRTKSSK